MKKTLVAFAFAMVVTAGLTWAGGAIGLSSTPSSAQVTAITVIADGGTFDTINARTVVATGAVQGGWVNLSGTAPGAGCIGASGSDQICVTPNSMTITAGGGLHISAGTQTDLVKLAGTSGSGTGVTAGTPATLAHWSQTVTVDKTAMTAAGQTDVTLLTTLVNTKLIALTADVTQVFAGGALSAVTVQCGNAAGGTQYLLANSVLTAQNTWGDANAEIGLNLIPGNAAYAPFGTSTAGIPGAIAISCRFICTGANCSAATTGSVTFKIEGVTYP